jgi:hypothetical protein
MMGVFAFACGLMIEPLTADRALGGRKRRSSPHSIDAAVVQRSGAAPAAAPLAPANRQSVTVNSPPRRAAARWGEDVNWPEAWRKPAKPDNAGDETAELDKRRGGDK